MRATVIVVSRHRPRELARCLASLVGQSHDGLEVVLVADPASVGICPDLAIKRVSYDIANISVARNLGIAQAAGDVVLFIDDDALADPCWARSLAAAFADPRVIAATGFTKGPDGLAWQARAERITPSGRSYPIQITGPSLLALENGDAVSTIGTNCAFRREALIAIGCFDPAFSFHLDESDVNLRLAVRFPDGLTAVVPDALVIHGLAAGTSRVSVGVPHDLRAIGRSTGIFAARHGGTTGWLVQAQRRRLLRLMVAGRLDPLAIGGILRSLNAGLAEALGPTPPQAVWSQPDPPDFLPFATSVAAPLFLAGWHWRRKHLRARAARATAQGHRVALLLLTPTALPHRLTLTDGGWWEQQGGVWGPSRPDDSPMLFYRIRDRISREAQDFAALQQ